MSTHKNIRGNMFLKALSEFVHKSPFFENFHGNNTPCPYHLATLHILAYPSCKKFEKLELNLFYLLMAYLKVSLFFGPLRRRFCYSDTLSFCQFVLCYHDHLIVTYTTAQKIILFRKPLFNY